MAEFKPISLIPGYEEFTMYEMNINGVLRREGRERKWSLIRGYLCCMLNMNGKRKTVKQHRAIALLFIPNPDNKPCIDHMNGIRHDNRVENLRWCTAAENQCNSKVQCNNISGHKNICKCCNKGSWYWQIRVRLNGKDFTKYFLCEQDDTEPPAEVITYRDQMLREHHGEFASYVVKPI